MVILIAGASHTGKTLLAQKLLEKYKIPYLSIDHLKMGLIRSGKTDITPCDDSRLTPFLWEIVREIVKTAVENSQNLIIEGVYIPFDWKNDFGGEYLKEIRFICLVMTEKYIRSHYEDIKNYSDVIENREKDTGFGIEELIGENRFNLEQCKKYGYDYIPIDEEYTVDIEL